MSDNKYERKYRAKELLQKYGQITEVEFVGYWKYEFYLRVKTEKGYLLEIDVGGNYEDIYRYDPLEEDWGEHAGGIQNLEELSHDGQ